MPDNDSFETELSILNDYYEQASDNSGEEQFYACLYNYIETIDKDELLNRAANDFWFSRLLEDYASDDNKLRKLLLPLVNTPSEKLTRPQQFILLRNLFEQVASEKLKTTKVYYSWYVLYFCYYGIYKLGVIPEELRKIDSIDLTTIDLKEVFGDEFAVDVELLRKLGHFDAKKFAAKLDTITSNAVPHDSTFTRDEYATALKVFHIGFKKWLPNNAYKFTEQEPQATEPLTKVSVDFLEKITKVTEIESGEPHYLPKLRKQDAPYRIYEHCLNNGWLSFADVITALELYKKESKIRKRNIPEILRNTLFAAGAPLEPFLKVDDKEEKIKAFKTTNVTAMQLDIIKNFELSKNPPNFVTTS